MTLRSKHIQYMLLNACLGFKLVLTYGMQQMLTTYFLTSLGRIVGSYREAHFNHWKKM